MSLTQSKPVILHEAGCDEGWADELRGRVRWRTFFDAGQTPTEALTAGVAEIEPGDQLKVHRHAAPELYYLLTGEGMVTIDGTEHLVRAGTAIFIPSNAAHGIRNTGQTLLRFFYAFAVNSFDEIEYIFPT